jgi:hypothetical protein
MPNPLPWDLTSPLDAATKLAGHMLVTDRLNEEFREA